VHIRWLREKLEQDPGQPRHLLTVRGVGYKFVR
jgi:DNA-binding response OmpR family regulator